MHPWKELKTIEKLNEIKLTNSHLSFVICNDKDKMESKITFEYITNLANYYPDLKLFWTKSEDILGNLKCSANKPIFFRNFDFILLFHDNNKNCHILHDVYN